MTDCWDATTAAHHVWKGDHGRVWLPVHSQTLQDLQGQEVSLHAHGVMLGWRTLDHPQVLKPESERKTLGNYISVHLVFSWDI